MKRKRSFIATIWLWVTLACLSVVSQGFTSSLDITSERISPDVVVEVSINDERKSDIASSIIQKGERNGFKPHEDKYDLSHFFDHDVFFVILEHPVGSRVIFTDAHDSGFVQIGFYEFGALEGGAAILSMFVGSILESWPGQSYIVKSSSLFSLEE